MSNHFSSHSSHPTKTQIAEEKAEAKAEAKEAKAKAGQPHLVETIEPEVKLDKEGKPVKAEKAPKIKLGAFDADRFAEELEAVVNDKSTTPNNPTVRFVLAELAAILQRSRLPKPEKAEKDEE